MAGDLFSLVAFTLVPLVVLAAGVVVSIAYASILEDRRILLSTALFLLMAVHQTTELWAFLAGARPYQNPLGEVLETAVNLLAVGAIGYVVWSLQAERQLRERLAIIQGTLVGDERVREEIGTSAPDTSTVARGFLGPGSLRIPGLGRIIGLLYTALPLGTTANLPAVLRTAVQNTRVTFPIAEFRVADIDAVTVLAEPTYLQEVLETVLERLVVYNDSSDPVVDIALECGTDSVTLAITDNGSGLPEEVTARMTGETTASPGTDDLELAYVHSYLEKWGGSVAVSDGTVTIRLLTPRSVSNANG